MRTYATIGNEDFVLPVQWQYDDTLGADTAFVCKCFGLTRSAETKELALDKLEEALRIASA